MTSLATARSSSVASATVDSPPVRSSPRFVTKQAASQLIDTLVLRGYLSRSTDPVDRRRMNISLTERGRKAADAVRAGVTSVDGQLNELLGITGHQQLRAGLIALCDIRDRIEAES
jgi:DNA-binding MarR family transcriptional regulator